MMIDAPDGRMSETASGSNTHGNEGSISISVRFTPDFDPYLNGTGSYNVTIECTQAGDHEPQFSIIGARDVTDSGNDWDLAVDYEYFVEKEE
jgi:hypothetical protein